MCVDVQVAGIKCIVFLDTIAPDHADHQVKRIVQFFQGHEVLLGKSKLSIVHLLTLAAYSSSICQTEILRLGNDQEPEGSPASGLDFKTVFTGHQKCLGHVEACT